MGIFYDSFRYDDGDKFTYPEDMKVIVDYLNSHGNIKCSAKLLEDLYGEFSDIEYAAGWMSITSDSGEVEELGQNLLREFERWLDEHR